MTADSSFQRAGRALFLEWAEAGRRQVAGYLASNGKEPPDPAKVAAACPACLGRPEVAAWHLRRLGAG
jgi:hypothetical protein